MSEHQCPRRDEGPAGAYPGLDTWRDRNGERSCSFCGSLHPDDFMAAVRDRRVVVGPTDKNYKVYVELAPTEFDIARARKTYADLYGCDPHDAMVEKRIAQGVTGPPFGSRKFYFQHLSVEQRTEFVDLMNARTMLIGVPGHFYRLPFFCSQSA